MKSYLIRILLLFVTITFTNVVMAQKAYKAIEQKAMHDYQTKQYDNALSSYQSLLKENPENALLYYNIANVYYRKNAIPEAILAYKNALFFNPDLKEASTNLKLAQSRITKSIKKHDAIFFVLWWQRVSHFTMSNTWAIIAVLCFLIWMIQQYLVRIKRKHIPIQVAVLTICICLCSVLLSFYAAAQKNNSTEVIVLKDDVSLYVAPNASSKKITTLIAGQELEIIKKDKNWIKVKADQQSAAWVFADQVALVGDTKAF